MEHHLTHQVIDHADNLDQLEQDVMNLDTDTSGLENRTSDIEQDVLSLEDDLEAADLRILDLEQIQLGTVMQYLLVDSSESFSCLRP